MADVRVGGCRCGQVRFALSGTPWLTMACHCTGCQKMTGGPFSVSVTMPETGFELTAGEPVIGGLHGEVRHFHCPHCMSWVFTRPPGIPMVNVRATMLDEPDDEPPFVELWTDEKLAWVNTPATHSYPSFPPEAKWPELIAAYAQAHAGGGVNRGGAGGGG